MIKLETIKENEDNKEKLDCILEGNSNIFMSERQPKEKKKYHRKKL